MRLALEVIRWSIWDVGAMNNWPAILLAAIIIKAVLFVLDREIIEIIAPL